MYRLAILDDYENAACKLADWSCLSQDVAIDVFHDHLADESELVKWLHPYDILLIMRERTAFPRSVLQQLPTLQLLITTGRVNNSIDLDTCAERGVCVCGTDSTKNAASELTWALILALLRKIPQADHQIRQGTWGAIFGNSIHEKKLGILGLGRIGTLVARVGQAFGMDIISWSRHLTGEQAAGVGVKKVNKDELFQQSDILTVHIGLNQESRGLIGARELALMQPTAFLINTSRGAIIDEQALLAALRNKHIAGAGLDVYPTEPVPANHPILQMPNTVLTPHIGYVTQENFQIFFRQAIENICAWLEGHPIRVVEPED